MIAMFTPEAIETYHQFVSEFLAAEPHWGDEVVWKNDRWEMTPCGWTMFFTWLGERCGCEHLTRILCRQIEDAYPAE
jgi:hypothetical protein